MDRYEWTEKESTYLVEADGSVYEDVEGVGHPQVGELPRFISREILRLAAEVDRLKAEAAFAPDRVLKAVREGERARIREALRSIALNSSDLRLNLGLGEIDAICQRD